MLKFKEGDKVRFKKEHGGHGFDMEVIKYEKGDSPNPKIKQFGGSSDKVPPAPPKMVRCWWLYRGVVREESYDENILEKIED